MGALAPEERDAVRARSPLGNRYDFPVNRESAYEILSRRASEREAAAPSSKQVEAGKQEEKRSVISEFLWGTKKRQGMVETMAKQAARTVGSQIGRRILRGLLGGILGGGR
jgi:hypothetical protein